MTDTHSLGAGLVREELIKGTQPGNLGGLPRGGPLETDFVGSVVFDRWTRGAGGQGPRCSEEHL